MKKLAFLLALLLLTGCAVRNTDTSAQPTLLPSASADTTPADFSTVIDTKDMDFTFTDRELAGTWEAQKAISIHGNGTSAEIGGTGAALEDGCLRIASEGVYHLTGTFTDLCVTIAAGEKDKVQLVLDGAALSNSNGPCIYIQSADKVFITLPEGTSSSVADGTSYSVTDGETTVDAAIFSRSDLCINGSGTLTVLGQYKHGVVSKDDLVIANASLNVTSASAALNGKDCVKITGAALTLHAGSDGLRSDNAEDESRGFVYLTDCTAAITAGNDGVQAETVLVCVDANLTLTTGGGSGSSLRSSTDSWKGLKSGGDLYLCGGTYAIDAHDDCIHSNSHIVIADGLFDLSSGDDGVHADTSLTISGGTLTVRKSYEGLESSKLVISGGMIDVTASDDGLNGAGGTDGSAMGSRFGRGMFSNGVGEIEISGGYIVVNASGDGIDSNGTIRVTGGVTLVSGPTGSGNGALDYDGEATVSGGILIAAGSSGMAQNFSSAENQGAMLVSLSRQTTGSIALVDENGRAVVSFTPDKAYQCVVITAPAIQQGGAYTLVTGGTIEGADANGFAQNAVITGGTTQETITMSSLVYSNSGFGMWTRPGGGGGSDKRPGGGDRPGGGYPGW